MNRVYLMIAVMSLIGLSGCATLGKPSPAALSTMPTVEFGNPIPQDTDYVLYFPKGKALPTTVLLEGNLFDDSANSQLSVHLGRDIYAHKQWVSFDQKTWVSARSVFEVLVDVRLPGYENPEPGLVTLTLNARE